MIRKFFAGLVSFILVLFLVVNTAVLLARVSQAEGLINIEIDPVDDYIYPDGAQWLKYDLTRKGKRVKDEKVYVSLSKSPPTDSPGEAFIIVDEGDNPYPEMPKDRHGKATHSLFRADYGWEWRSDKDRSLKTEAVRLLSPFLRKPIGAVKTTFEKDKDKFVNISIINYLVSLAVVLIPGLIIRKLLRRA